MPSITTFLKLDWNAQKKVHKEGAAANLTNNVRATAGNLRTTKHYTMYVTLFRVSCLKSFPRDI